MNDTSTPVATTPAPRKAPHPMFLIAAAAVAGVAVIAGAQMLRAGDSASAKMAPNAATAAAPGGSAAAASAASNASAPAGSATTGNATAAQGTASSAKTATPATAAPRTTTATAAPACSTCGVVVAVREVRQAGEGTGVGAVAGGVVGGVVGHQFGGGRGKDVLTVAGAVGGAVAGHQIEKQARATTSWRVDVRMNDGTQRTFTYASQPAFAAGEKIEVRGTQLLARG